VRSRPASATPCRAVFGPNPRAHLFMEGGFVGALALEYIKPTPKPGRTIAAAPLPAHRSKRRQSGCCRCGLHHPFRGRRGCTRASPLSQLAGSRENLGVYGRDRFTAQGRPPQRLPNALVRTEARQMTQAKVVRLDGSDLLPGSPGSDLGATLQRVLEQPEQRPQLMKAFQSKAARVFRQ
jgi:hypothetical protein